MNRKIPKQVFIDSNNFILCAYEEIIDVNLNILEEIYKKLQNNEMILLLPEVIEREIITELDVRFKIIKDAIPEKFEKLNFIKEIKNNKSKLINKLIKESQEKFLTEVASANDKILDIVNKIFKHKNTKKIKITDKIILSGIRRSLLKRPPYTSNKDKQVFLKDVDCIAFEALVEYLNREGVKEKYDFVICTEDGDYFEEENKLCNEIRIDIENICKNIVSYNNPLEMLKTEFKVGYSKKQVEEFKEKNIVSLIQGVDSYFAHESAFAVGNENNGVLSAYDPSIFTQRVNEYSETCPVCLNNIEKYIKGFLAGPKGRPYFITHTRGIMYDRKDFECPYCKTKFSFY